MFKTELEADRAQIECHLEYLVGVRQTTPEKYQNAVDGLIDYWRGVLRNQTEKEFRIKNRKRWGFSKA